MTNPPKLTQTLSEDQVQAITQRALELQLAGESGDGQANLESTTLDQLTLAAEEVGVSRELVMRAAAELLEPPELHADTLPVMKDGNWMVDTILAGRLDPDDVPQLLASVQQLMKTSGEWQFTNGGFLWHHPEDGKLTLMPVGRNTRVTLQIPAIGYQAPIVICVAAAAALVTFIVTLLLGLGFTEAAPAVILMTFLAGAAAALNTKAPLDRAAQLRRNQSQRMLETVKSFLQTE